MTREEIDSKGDVVGRFTEAGKTYSDYKLEKDLPDILAQ
jgi:cell shape-determining protein MreC